MRLGWLGGLAGLGLLLWQLTPFHGSLGHDFYHYFARAYVGMAHFWQNGWAVPHYTPSLCGGGAVFADPQSMYYSVPQWLSFVMDPLIAVLLTHVIFYSLGYVGCVVLFRRRFGAAPLVAHWGALAFLLNGFAFAHLLVGHLTHHSYLLFPWLLYLLWNPALSPARRVGWTALLLSYVVYSGSLHVAVVFLGGGLLALPLVVAFLGGGGWRGELRYWLCTLGLTLAACSPKLAAAAAFSPSFLERPIDRSALSMVQLLWQYFWFDPKTVPLTIPFGVWHFGPWEYVGFVSVLLIPAVPAATGLVLGRRPRGWPYALGLAGAAFLLVYLGAAGHAEFQLPLLKDYHNPIKLYGAFIPFLILAAVVALSELKRWPKLVPTTSWVKTALFAVAVLCLLLEFRVKSQFFVRSPLVYGYRYDPSLYPRLKALGKLPTVTAVSEDRGRDVELIFEGKTSNRCFEPLFGYRREVMKATVTAGPTDRISDKSFNLTHPGCLVYPEYFKCNRWDRIPEGERTAFERFTEGAADAFPVPLWLIGLLRLSGAAWLAILFLALFGVPSYRRQTAEVAS